MPKGDSPLLMTISREAARILRSSTVLEHQYEAMAHTIRGGRLVKGRWAFRVPLQEARDLVSWCIHQADRIRGVDIDAAVVLEGAASDVASAIARPSGASSLDNRSTATSC